MTVLPGELAELLDPLDEDWKLHANCRDKPASWFFPKRGTNTRLAQQVCAGCPVFSQCAAYAEATHSEGFWAGEMH